MDDPRIGQILSDRWISFPRSEAVLRLLHELLLAPRQTRMPGVIIHGASGIGKTMIARKLRRDFRPTFDAAEGSLSHASYPPAGAPSTG